MNKIFAALNELKNLYGYEAQIDNPAGLPYKIQLVDDNPYEKDWSTLFYKSDKEDKFLGKYINSKSPIWKSYITYLKNNTTHHIPENCYNRPCKLSEFLSFDDIRTTYSSFLADNSTSFPAPTKNNKFYSITYQRAFKLPMFGATISEYDDATPDMDCIREFHFLPYYTSSELFTVYKRIKKDVQKLKNSPLHYLHNTGSYILSSVSLDVVPVVDNTTSSLDSDSDSEITYPLPIKRGYDPSSQITQKITDTEEGNSLPIKNREKTIGNNCVYNHTQYSGNIRNEYNSDDEIKSDIYPESIDWSYFTENEKDSFEIDMLWDNYRQNKKDSNVHRYEDKLEEVRAESNTMKRTSIFIRVYINNLGRIPSVEEAEAEYIVQGLNRNNQGSTQNRRNRFNGCIAYYSKEYDESRNGFKLNWEKNKENVLKLMKRKVSSKYTPILCNRFG
jgi:hypothetical protein